MECYLVSEVLGGWIMERRGVDRDWVGILVEVDKDVFGRVRAGFKPPPTGRDEEVQLFRDEIEYLVPDPSRWLSNG